MIYSEMKFRITAKWAICLALACAAWPVNAQKKPQQQLKPLAGPRATALRITWLYITASTSSEAL